MSTADDDYEGEPIGSCENCGVNLYEGDDAQLCDQCEWYAAQWSPSQPSTSQGGGA